MRRALFPLLALAFGCLPTEVPGETAGTFEIVGALQENSCGSTALPANDPLLFAAEVRVDGSQAFWRRPDEASLPGTVIDGEYRFTFRQQLPVLAPDPTTGYVGCALIQEETIQAVIDDSLMFDDAGAPLDQEDAEMRDAGADADEDAGEDGDAGEPMPVSASFEGTDVVVLAPAPGSNCVPLLAVAGGPFLELPCSVEYTLRGSVSDPF